MTGITVVYNSKDLIKRAYNSIREFHPLMPILIIDGSDPEDPCYKYLDMIASRITLVKHMRYNIGHGRGMHLALRMVKTRLALVFDSDIVMLESPVPGMLQLMDEQTYGVGWIYQVGEDGYDYGTPGRIQMKPVPYLHPYFQLVNVEMYKRFSPYCHHGAPCYKAMRDIYDRGLSEKILKQYPGLTGHTSGQGINWIGRPSKYIRHDFGGTRIANRLAGKKEIEEQWD